MLIFIVADIWNCYNMDMKKATNLKVLIIFKQPHCMEIRNRLSLKQEVAQMANEDKKDFNETDYEDYLKEKWNRGL